MLSALICCRPTMEDYISVLYCFFFNDTATTEIYTLSLHDALPIGWSTSIPAVRLPPDFGPGSPADRKSTRLNSSHEWISYAVFCLKKKKKIQSTFSTLIKQKNNSKTNYSSITT